jgi:hypothetical protein
MDVYSELGPLDVQLIKQNEIALRKSGLLSKSSFDALADAAFELYERLMMNITVKSRGNVSFQMASELSAGMTSTALAPIYSQMNPDVIGSEHRDLNVATEYGDRLAAKSCNAKTDTVKRLVKNYPAHDFVIDMEEARDLFRFVDYPSENLYRVVGALGPGAYNEAPGTMVFALAQLATEENEDGQTSDDDEPSAEQEMDDSGGEDRPCDTGPRPAGPGNDPIVEQALQPSEPPQHEADERIPDSKVKVQNAPFMLDTQA